MLLGISVILSSVPYSFAQSDDHALVDATAKITRIGATLVQSSIQNGDLESASEYSKFTAEFYAHQVNTLRSSNVESADDLHLLLIDIHSKIASKTSLDSISTDLDSVFSHLDKFPKSDQTSLVVANMLSIADQSYQTAMVENSQPYHVLSHNLVEEASILFDSDGSFDARQKVSCRHSL